MPPMKNVYLDHHATTPVDPRVLDVMLPYLRDQFGNPSSVTHPHGLNAKEAVEKARTQVASAFGTNARSVVFTSGATEANNLALLGVAERAPSGRDRRDHFITQASEHQSRLTGRTRRPAPNTPHEALDRLLLLRRG